MKTKIIVGILVVLAVLGGAYVMTAQQRKAQAPSNSQQPVTNTQAGQQISNNQAPAPAATSTAATSTQGTPEPLLGAEPQYSGELGAEGADTMVFEVAFDGSTFAPAELKVKPGDIVVFKNQSKTDFWPASDPHPTHTAYPGFDAKAKVGPGQSFDFKFTKPGTWGYHNHLSPAVTGKIIVE